MGVESLLIDEGKGKGIRKCNNKNGVYWVRSDINENIRTYSPLKTRYVCFCQTHDKEVTGKCPTNEIPCTL